ncbi:MAG: BolA family transcriptional regulator [Proteobacteria bacterium]|nr:BolA family transcriptional regulator [Pseudomonadota bacterium]
MTTVAERMRTKLESAFAPAALKIADDSHKHAGHAGARAEGETHFTVTIVSDAFAGKSRVDRQRLVHAALAAELAGPVHALALVLRTPAEAG